VDRRTRAPWRPRLVAGAVVLQVVVPAVALANGVPSRFGFHMYSGRDLGLAVEVVDARGRSLAVDMNDYTASGRPELDWTEVLPEAICRKTPEAAEVVVRSQGHERSVTCVR
jgi:hypothetical protein